MLFEPESLLFLARRSGLDIYRRGGRLVVASETGIPKVWAEAIKRHKPELMPLLPNHPETPAKKRTETQANQGQLELFEPIQGQAVAPVQGRQRKARAKHQQEKPVNA